MLNGTQVSFSILWPRVTTSLTKPMVATVDPDAVEIANTRDFDIKDNVTLVAAAFDVSDARLDYTVIDTKPGTFGVPPGSDGFNGFSASFAALGGASGVTLFAVDLIIGATAADLAAADISFTDTSVFVNLEGLDHVAGDALSLLLGFRFDGTNAADRLTGNVGRDALFGAGGSDRLRGAAGNDLLQGGNGDDTLDGGTGGDRMIGSAGNDAYFVDDAADRTIEERNGGRDTVFSRINWTLAAQLEVLTLQGSGRIDGTGNSGHNLINGTSGRNLLSGGEGNDTLNGQAGDDTLNGGAGNDAMRGGSGADQMAGGADDDTYSVDDAGDAITETATGGTDRVIATVDYILAEGVEELILAEIGGGGTRLAAPPRSGLNGTGNAGNNLLTGNSDDNALNGLDGDDTLIGNGGNDALDGGAGIDSMTGGTGDDDYFVGAPGDIVIEAAGEGTDRVFASVDWVLGSDVENLTLTGSRALMGTGNTQANTLRGNSGNNQLLGLAGDDSLFGGAGRDTLRGGTGADAMTGGSGNDSYVVDHRRDTTVEVSGGGTDDVTALLNWTLAGGVENLILAELPGVPDGPGLSGTGNSANNRITGNSDSNLLAGMAGDDSLFGGAGQDVLRGGTGADAMTGGDGGDSYFVDNAGDSTIELPGGGTDNVTAIIDWTLAENVENLTLAEIIPPTEAPGLNGFGNTGNNQITGNSDDNRLGGAEGDDSLFGGLGNDTLNGGAGVDQLAGGAGDDDYFVDDPADLVSELSGEGTDRIFASVSWILGAEIENLTLLGNDPLNATGNTLRNEITGNTGDNLLAGFAGDDTLYGGAGQDSLRGGFGSDLMDGGNGSDSYFVDDAGDITQEFADGGTDEVTAFIDWTLGDELENLTLAEIDPPVDGPGLTGIGNAANNRIVGNSDDNSLAGLDGNDTLFGGAGWDSLNGGIGADAMAGGTGDDLYQVDHAGDTTFERAGEGIDLVVASLDWVLATETENLILSGNGNSTGTGNGLDNIIEGNAGNNLLAGLSGSDTLFGGLGNDLLRGGTGADEMTGGDGNDTYFVDDALDLMIELEGGGIDLVQSALDWTLDPELENLILLGSENLTGTGNGLNNEITGNTGANFLVGNDGADTIFGDEGDDTLRGGTGADLLDGGNGNDSYFVDDLLDEVVETGGHGQDLVTAAVDWVLSAEVEDLTLIGTGPMSGIGNALGNVITGNDGDSVIDGVEGSDTLFGGLGLDTLFGGIDNDVLNGGDADDFLSGDDGDDLLSGDDGNDDLSGGAGNDTIAGGLGNDAIDGGDGFNALSGGAGSDQLTGGIDDDTLDGGLDDDQMAGGLGNDLYRVDHDKDIVTDTGGNDSIEAAINWALLDDTIEHLFLTGSLALIGVGAFGADDIHANDAGNQLIGGEGNDTLTGGTGADLLQGETEDDQLFGDNGDDTLEGSDGFDALAGGSGFDLLYGGDDDDTLTGGTGDDTIDGGAGNDGMAGSEGNDVYAVDSDADLVSEAANEGIDTVVTDLSAYTLGAEVENLIFLGESRSVGTGNGLDNTILGNFGSNILSGLDGNDTLNGGVGGGDTLNGGTGADQFVMDLGGGLVDVEDFEDGVDLIVFAGMGATFDSVSIFEDSLSGGTYVQVSDDGFLLQGISASQIDASDFLFT